MQNRILGIQSTPDLKSLFQSHLTLMDEETKKISLYLSFSLLLKVLHTAVDDDVISQQRVSCLAQKFHFQKLPLSANHQEYQVCARIEAASSPGM